MFELHVRNTTFAARGDYVYQWLLNPWYIDNQVSFNNFDRC